LLKGIYTIVSQDTTSFELQMASENHPIFQAHFPDYALLPGYALIDIISKILEDDIKEIKRCKFISPVLPGDIISGKIEVREKRKNIKIFKNKIKISEVNYETT
jgi:3-hydroxymyristoyl/3-hydroxydecanoyl-(acyl carrier protein) dehydratase